MTKLNNRFQYEIYAIDFQFCVTNGNLAILTFELTQLCIKNNALNFSINKSSETFPLRALDEAAIAGCLVEYSNLPFVTFTENRSRHGKTFELRLPRRNILMRKTENTRERTTRSAVQNASAEIQKRIENNIGGAASHMQELSKHHHAAAKNQEYGDDEKATHSTMKKQEHHSLPTEEQREDVKHYAFHL